MIINTIEKRKELYRLGTHNPYDIRHFKEILPNRMAEAWKQYIKNCLRKIPTLGLKKVIGKIPILTFYPRKLIENAQILFISNEPGLSTKIKDIYAPLQRRQTLSRLSRLQKISMFSWLSMTNFNSKSKKINGYTGLVGGSIEHSVVFNYYGKIGAFLEKGDKLREDCKVIHIDLFPFPQSSIKDYNPRNRKSQIAHFIETFNFSDIDYTTRFQDNKLPRPGFLSLYHTLYNIYLLKVFCNTPKNIDKKIFIIGNRVFKDKDVNYIIFKFLVEIVMKTHINVRISTEWPNATKPINYIEIN